MRQYYHFWHEFLPVDVNRVQSAEPFPVLNNVVAQVVVE